MLTFESPVLCFYFSIGARPKFTKRNSMDSVELWKYSSEKVNFAVVVQNALISNSNIFASYLFLQNGENQEADGMMRKAKSQQSQQGKRKGYSDSQSSDERSWLDSPLDTDDITVHVPPPVPVSCSGLQLNGDNIVYICSSAVSNLKKDFKETAKYIFYSQSLVLRS